MFYLVAIFLVIYVVGMCCYLIYGKVKKKIQERRDRRFGGNNG